MDDLTGKSLKGYQILERIGEGGFGEVYRAFQPGIDREVAIKIILPLYANHPDFIRRFEVEAQVVARLEHPFILPIFDFWRDPEGAYLVIRWLPQSLKKIMKRQGAIEPAHVVQIVEQISSALATAHRNNVIHRDIKPDNILLDKDGNAYLTDFGIAKVLNPDGAEDEELSGTPAYMAPEQFTGKPVSAQTDVYQLAVLVYEMLAGKHPFDRTDVNTVVNGHLYVPFPALPDRFARATPILQKAAHKIPQERYADTLQFATDLRGALLGRGGSTLLLDIPAQRNPYKGLRAFEEADGDDFFGREKLVENLVETVVSDATKFMAIIGPSGSGKSSVVRAGLIPALRKHSTAADWFIIDMLPGENPIQELASALLRVALSPQPDIVEQLQFDPNALAALIDQIMPGMQGDLLLFIDQFEELFTLVSNEQVRRHFLTLLHSAAISPNSRLKIIIALRADFYDRPLMYEGFGELMQQQTRVILPLSTEELERAITHPAQRAGFQVEPDFLAQIINDIRAEPGALPLLQYALTEVYERREGRRLTLAAYQSSGGVSGALARRADEVYERLTPQQQKIARQIFLRLVTLGEGTEDTRRRTRLSDLTTLMSHEVQTVLNAFGKYYLLSFDHNSETREPTVEVAHEALIRSWGQLREWLNTSRDDIRFLHLLSIAAAEWEAAHRDPSFLLTGTRLHQFEDWATAALVDFTQQEQQFLNMSIAARQTQQTLEMERQARELQLAQEAVESEKRRAGQLRLFVRLLGLGGIILLAVAALAINLGFEAHQNATESERRAQLARALALSAQADLELRGAFPERAVLLSLAALDDYPYTWHAERTLMQAVLQNRSYRVFDRENPVNGIAFSADGRYVASADQAGEVFIWNISSQNLEAQFSTGSAGLTGLAFSPDGTALLTASFSGKVIVWDWLERVILQETSHNSVVYSAVFNADGTQIASISTEGTLRVWNAVTGETLWELMQVDIRNARTLVFSPDQTTIATASFDTIHIFDAKTGREISHFTHDGSDVNSLAYSPDGRFIVTANADSTLRIWNINAGTELMTLTGHTASVDAVAYSPDGTQIVSASRDHSARVWSAITGAELYHLAGHTAAVSSALFNPDGQLIATASQDGTVRLWKNRMGFDGQVLGSHQQIATSLAFSQNGNLLVSVGWDRMAFVWNVETGEQVFSLPHEGWLNAAAVSPDGTLIATASREGMARLWESATGELKLTYAEHTSVLDAIVFSPDNTWVASGGSDRSVRIWDTQTGETRMIYTEHRAGISDLAVSPDGRLIASASFDGTVHLWERATGQQRFVLRGHEGGVTAVDFSADGSLIVTAGVDQTIRIWNADTGNFEFMLVGHSDVVNAVAFNARGNRIVSASDDSTIRIWDIPSRQIIVTFSGDGLDFNDAIFNGAGTLIAAAGDDGSVRLWQTWPDAEELQEYARKCCVFRELSAAERVLFDLR